MIEEYRGYQLCEEDGSSSVRKPGRWYVLRANVCAPWSFRGYPDRGSAVAALDAWLYTEAHVRLMNLGFQAYQRAVLLIRVDPNESVEAVDFALSARWHQLRDRFKELCGGAS